MDRIPPGRAREFIRRLDGAIEDASANDFQSKVVKDGETYIGRFAGDCRFPYMLNLNTPPGVGVGKPHWKWVDELPEWEVPDFIERVAWLEQPMKQGFSARFYVRCWKCRECQHWRRTSWVYRAVEEMRCHERTWLGTLTFSPDCLARANLQTESERAALEHFAVREGQGFLKRVRASGITCRYLMVTEFGGQTGRLHLHALVHTSKSTRGKDLEKRWTNGFTHWRLVRRGHKHGYLTPAEYIAKYLTKDCTTRVRASLGYGSFPSSDLVLPPKVPDSQREGVDLGTSRRGGFPADQTGLDAPF